MIKLSEVINKEREKILDKQGTDKGLYFMVKTAAKNQSNDKN